MLFVCYFAVNLKHKTMIKEGDLVKYTNEYKDLFPNMGNLNGIFTVLEILQNPIYEHDDNGFCNPFCLMGYNTLAELSNGKTINIDWITGV